MNVSGLALELSLVLEQLPASHLLLHLHHLIAVESVLQFIPSFLCVSLVLASRNTG